MPLTVTILPSSTLLRENSTVTVDVTAYGDSPGADRTVFFVDQETGGKINVTDVLRGTNAPAIVSEGASGLFDYFVNFNNKPGSAVGSAWTVRFVLQGDAGAYGEQDVTFQVYTIDNPTGEQRSFGSQSVTFNLVNQNGQGEAPTVPTGISLTPESPSQIRVGYTAPINADGVTIERDTNPLFTAPVSVNVGGNGAKSYASTGMATFTNYHFRLRSYSNPSGTVLTSSWSARYSAVTLELPSAPSAVTNYVATGIDPSTIQVTWTPSARITEGAATYANTYSLLCYNASGGALIDTITGPPGTVIGPQTSTLSWQGRASNTVYYFKVRVTNAGGSTDTAEFSGRTAISPQAPDAPSGAAAVVSNFTTVTLSWTDNSTNETGFRVLRGTAAAGPFTQIAEVGAGVTSYADLNLANSTTYYYQVYAYNQHGNSAVTSANATTSAARANPGQPSGLLAVAKNDTQIELNWTLVAPLTETGIAIKRGTASGGPYATVATAPVSATNYVDTGLTPGATYYYVVSAQGDAGNSANSAQASATTFQRSVTVAAVSSFFFHPLSKNMIIQIANRMIFTSDRDRWVVEIASKQYRAGLKRILTAATLSDTTGGTLEAGTYRIFVVLYRSYDETRSLPNPVATRTIVAGKRIIVSPPMNAGNTGVKCRDVGYDITGTLIEGCDFWEIYVGSTTQAKAYRVAQLPLAKANWGDGAGNYTLDASLNLAAIFNSGRRPMEVQEENSLPPAAYRVEAQENRLVATAETDIELSQADIDASASLSISQGAVTFTVSNYTLSDAIIYHELYLNGNPTEWEVYDVEGTIGYIRHHDASVNTAGFRDAGGAFTSFSFGANKSRVYYSGFYSGEENGGLTFSPETFPPLTIQQNQFFPDDNTNPNGLINVGNELLVSKPAKWMVVAGGQQPGYPIIEVRSLSRGSGLNAPGTMSRDANDRVYYLGDSGPFVVDPSGVDKVTIYTGNAHLFQGVFDINSVADAIGSYFSREDWFVVVGLNRIGSHTRTDGFVLDTRNSAILPFSTPFEVTAIKEIKNVYGEFQLMYGNPFGHVGILMKRGISSHGTNYTLPLPNAAATSMSGYMRSGLLDTEHRLYVRDAQTRLRTSVPDVELPCYLQVIERNRNSDVYSRVVQKSKMKRFNSNDTRDHFTFGSHGYQNAQIEFGFEIPVQYGNCTLSWSDIALDVMTKGSSA